MWDALGCDCHAAPPSICLGLRPVSPYSCLFSCVSSTPCIVSALRLAPTATRQICQDTRCSQTTPTHTFSVTISSFISQNYTLVASLQDRTLKLHTPISVVATANAPVFLRYRFDQADHVFFEVRSEGSGEDMPAVVSLQNGTCPIYDLPSDVSFTGIHQTITRLGSVQLKRHQLGRDIYFVLVVQPDRNCKVPQPKNFTVTAYPARAFTTYTTPIVATLLLFLVMPYVIYWLFISVEWLRGFGFNERVPSPTWLEEMTASEGSDTLSIGSSSRRDMAVRQPLSLSASSPRNYGTVQSPATSSAAAGARRLQTEATISPDEEDDPETLYAREEAEAAEVRGMPSAPAATTDAAVNAVAYDLKLSAGALSPHSKAMRQWDTGINYKADDVRVLRGQPVLRVNHLTRKLPRSQDKKFSRFSHELISLFAFYAVPAVSRCAGGEREGGEREGEKGESCNSDHLLWSTNSKSFLLSA